MQSYINIASNDYNLLTKLKDLISLAPINWHSRPDFPFESQEQLLYDTDKSKDCRHG
jgi:hypothetical protein